MSLVPSLLQAIVRVDGDALVMHAGDKPYVVSPTGQVDLASRGLSLEAVDGIVAQLLSVESRGALDEFGAVQYELPPAVEFPGEKFTVVAARGGDDLWVEVRRHRVPDDDRIPDELFASSPAESMEDDRVPAELLAVPPDADVAAPHAERSVASFAPTTTDAAHFEDDDLNVPDATHLFPPDGEHVAAAALHGVEAHPVAMPSLAAVASVGAHTQPDAPADMTATAHAAAHAEPHVTPALAAVAAVVTAATASVAASEAVASSAAGAVATAIDAHEPTVSVAAPPDATRASVEVTARVIDAPADIAASADVDRVLESVQIRITEQAATAAPAVEAPAQEIEAAMAPALHVEEPAAVADEPVEVLAPTETEAIAPPAIELTEPMAVVSEAVAAQTAETVAPPPVDVEEAIVAPALPDQIEHRDAPVSTAEAVAVPALDVEASEESLVAELDAASPVASTAAAATESQAPVASEAHADVEHPEREVAAAQPQAEPVAVLPEPEIVAAAAERDEPLASEEIATAPEPEVSGATEAAWVDEDETAPTTVPIELEFDEEMTASVEVEQDVPTVAEPRAMLVAEDVEPGEPVAVEIDIELSPAIGFDAHEPLEADEVASIASHPEPLVEASAPEQFVEAAVGSAEPFADVESHVASEAASIGEDAPALAAAPATAELESAVPQITASVSPHATAPLDAPVAERPTLTPVTPIVVMPTEKAAASAWVELDLDLDASPAMASDIPETFEPEPTPSAHPALKTADVGEEHAAEPVAATHAPEPEPVPAREAASVLDDAVATAAIAPPEELGVEPVVAVASVVAAAAPETLAPADAPVAEMTTSQPLASVAAVVSEQAPAGAHGETNTELEAPPPVASETVTPPAFASLSEMVVAPTVASAAAAVAAGLAARRAAALVDAESTIALAPAIEPAVHAPLATPEPAPVADVPGAVAVSQEPEVFDVPMSRAAIEPVTETVIPELQTRPAPLLASPGAQAPRVSAPRIAMPRETPVSSAPPARDAAELPMPEPARPIAAPPAVRVPAASLTSATTVPPRPQPVASAPRAIDAPVVAPVPPPAPADEAARAPEPAVVLPMSRNPIRTEQPFASTGDPTMDGLQRLLRISAARGASTLYVSSDARPSVRVDGELQGLDSEPILTARDIESLLLTLMPERSHEALRTGAPSEWMCDIADVGRVRCTTFRDHTGPGGVFRLMPTKTVSAEQLGLPKAIQALAIEPEGLVLVAGTRSSGKRTLISAFVDLINRTRRDHVITIERDINIVHPRLNSFISQREVRGSDSDLLAASRAALREDPDVLVIEDLRTGPLMNVALEAAASGRLVIAGFSAHTATAAIDRIIDLYAPDQRHQVQLALADTVRGVIAQVLLRKTGGGRVAARELLLNTPAVSSVIAEGKTSQLPMAIEGGRRHGMMPLSDALVALVQSGVVDAREAYRHASDRAGLLAALKRQGVDISELAPLSSHTG